MRLKSIVFPLLLIYSTSYANGPEASSSAGPSASSGQVAENSSSPSREGGNTENRPLLNAAEDQEAPPATGAAPHPRIEPIRKRYKNALLRYAFELGAVKRASKKASTLRIDQQAPFLPLHHGDLIRVLPPHLEGLKLFSGSSSREPGEEIPNFCLKKFRSLKALDMPVSSFRPGTAKGLYRLHNLERLNLTDIKGSLPRVSPKLKELSLRGRTLPSSKRLGQVLSHLNRLETLIIDFDEEFEGLDLRIFTKKLPCLKKLFLSLPPADPLGTLSQTLPSLLSQLESFTLSASTNFLKHFQGVEKLENSSIQNLGLTTRLEAAPEPGEVAGFSSIFGLKNLKALQLKGTSFRDLIRENCAPSSPRRQFLNDTKGIPLTSLSLDILSFSSAEKVKYPEGFEEFFRILAAKAPSLTSLSLTHPRIKALIESEDEEDEENQLILNALDPTGPEDLLASQRLEAVFEDILPKFSLKQLDLQGSFTKRALEKLFNSEILKTGQLTRLGLDVNFLQDRKRLSPTSLTEFLGHFIPQEKGKPSTPAEAYEALGLSKDLHIFFKARIFDSL